MGICSEKRQRKISLEDKTNKNSNSIKNNHYKTDKNEQISNNKNVNINNKQNRTKKKLSTDLNSEEQKNKPSFLPIPYDSYVLDNKKQN